MNKVEIPKYMVVIDWQNRTMSFRFDENTIADVKFKEERISGADVFRVFCAVAIAQECYNTTPWPIEKIWLSEKMWDIIFSLVGYSGISASLLAYWSRVKHAKKCIEISINHKKLKDAKKYSIELFQTRGHDHFFGKREKLPNGQYKYWDVKFVNSDGPDFKVLKEGIISALSELKTTGYFLKGKGEDLVRVVPQTMGSSLTLETLVKGATKCVFVTGQNLISLVEDEVVAHNEGKQIKGTFRKCFEDWLDAPDKQAPHTIKLMICDPCSETSVLHYTIMYGEDFIDDLCDAIPRYQQWYKEMKSKGFYAGVTLATPMTLTIIDAEMHQNNDKAKIVITPPNFDPKSLLRPAFLITNKENHGIFSFYYAGFCEYMKRIGMRTIDTVSPDDIRFCQQLKDKYHKIMNLRQSKEYISVVV